MCGNIQGLTQQGLVAARKEAQARAARGEPLTPVAAARGVALDPKDVVAAKSPTVQPPPQPQGETGINRGVVQGVSNPLFVNDLLAPRNRLRGGL